ncbi:hypothetical protein ACLEPN_05075 [Myxococcus sp. 1LA]
MAALGTSLQSSAAAVATLVAPLAGVLSVGAVRATQPRVVKEDAVDQVPTPPQELLARTRQ